MTTDPQTPRPGEIFLDHVGWFVPDIGAAAEAFARLGFVLTDYTEHRNATADGGSVPSGTANRCAMLERGYLEILTAVPGVDSALTRQLEAGIARYTGVHLIAFTVGDAAEARERLAVAGFTPDPVVNLRRPVRTDTGGEGMTAFSVIRIPPAEMPEGRIQILTQDTPDLVWQPGLIARDNAVEALTGILLRVADPAEAAERYGRFTGRNPRAIDGGAAIILDRGRIAFVAPGAAGGPVPAMVAVGLRSRDLAATRAFLAGRGVPFADAADHLVVDPAAAMGTALVIHAEGAAERLYRR
ncbi:MAG: VOC family protein [Rhodospirillaceae bacterium]